MRYLKGEAVLLIIIAVLLTGGIAEAFTTEASYYTTESCLREGTSGVMANGRALDDEKCTAASWDYRFGTKLRVRNIRNDREVVVTVTDKGPAKRLYRQGRKIDLSKAAMEAIGGIRQGIVTVEVTKITEVVK